MEKKKRQKTGARGMILAVCPVCKGKGKVPRELPFRANPKASATRADKLGMETCPRCKGKGGWWRPCDECDGGKEKFDKDEAYEVSEVCKTCRGTGTYTYRAGPTVAQFIEVLGEPFKKQEIAGERYWYYNCRDGVIQLKVVVGSGRYIYDATPNLY